METQMKLLYIQSSSYRKDWQSILHTHSFCEIFYVTRGSGMMLLNNSKHKIQKDDIVLINPNTIHTETSSFDSSLSYIVLGIENLKFHFHETSPSSSCNIQTCPSWGQGILSLLYLMLEENHSKRENYDKILQNYLSALLLKISQTTKHDLLDCRPEKISADCLFLKEYIDTNFNHQINLDKLAEMLHHSKYHLCHTFSKTYGIAPMKYLLEKRLLTAKDLLCNSDFNISHIAEMTGFSSEAYFSQIFKQHTGLSPRKFREMN